MMAIGFTLSGRDRTRSISEVKLRSLLHRASLGLCLIGFTATAPVSVAIEDCRLMFEYGSRWKTASLSDVSNCLKAGANVNMQNRFGDTPLHHAAQDVNDPAILQLLLKAGANFEARDTSRNTPLVEAVVFNSNPAVADFLLKVGADPNVLTSEGMTPLHLAAQYADDPAMLQVLLKAGADLESTDSSQSTPLFTATAINSNPTIVDYLVKAGANVNASNASGFTPLHYARNAETVAILLAAGADPRARSKDGTTPVEAAKHKNNSANLLAAFRAFEQKQTKSAAAAEEKRRKSVAAAEEKRRKPVAAAEEKRRKSAAAREQKVQERLRAKQVSCDDWNTTSFFMLASVADVSRCIETNDPNARDDAKGRGPLHLVAMVGNHPAVVGALTKAGADLDARDNTERTPLHLAILIGKSPEIVTALVNAGADIDAPDKLGRTPLQLADEFSDSPALAAALRKTRETPGKSAGASAETASRVSCDMWNTAAFFRDVSLAALSRCLEVEDPNARNENGRTPLHYVAQGEAPAFVAALAEAGAEVNAPDERGGWTPLHLAAWFGKSPVVVQALLDAGADPEVKDASGRAPWDYLGENRVLKDFEPRPAGISCDAWNTTAFFEHADDDDVSHCLTAGTDVNARDDTGATPLHAAVQRSGAPAVVMALLAAGARVSARDDTGATPLHVAAMRSTSAAVVEALLEAGADPTARDDAGKTFRDYAEANPALDDSGLLSRPEGLSCEDWNTAVYFEHAAAENVTRCLEAGANVNARDEAGATPLHLAARHATTPAVFSALVDAGARLDARDATGAMPLHAAASMGMSPVAIHVLLAAGADPEAKDESGKTPWDYAKANPSLEETGLARWLARVSCEDWNTAPFFERADAEAVTRCLEAGAQAGARNAAQATPLHFAASESEAPAVVQVLLDAGADPAARDGQGKSPWDYAKANPALKGTEVYWHLNEGRFD